MEANNSIEYRGEVKFPVDKGSVKYFSAKTKRNKARLPKTNKLVKEIYVKLFCKQKQTVTAALKRIDVDLTIIQFVLGKVLIAIPPRMIKQLIIGPNSAKIKSVFTIRLDRTSPN